MSTKTKDTRPQVRLLMNAYVEALVGVFALRLPSVKATVVQQAPTMSIASSYPGADVILDAARVVNECQLSGHEIQSTITQISNVFVAAMWEALVSHATYDSISTEPDIQFFRHFRNACGHNGLWNFKELKCSARWRDKELTLAHSGQPAFGGLLLHGDAMLLMVDIDKKYFEQ